MGQRAHKCTYRFKSDFNTGSFIYIGRFYPLRIFTAFWRLRYYEQWTLIRSYKNGHCRVIHLQDGTTAAVSDTTWCLAKFDIFINWPYIWSTQYLCLMNVVVGVVDIFLRTIKNLILHEQPWEYIWSATPCTNIIINIIPHHCHSTHNFTSFNNVTYIMSYAQLLSCPL